MVAHNHKIRTRIDRRDGFVNRVAERYPEIEVVTDQYVQGDHLKSTEANMAILAANQGLNGIFGTNEGSAIGEVNGVRELGTHSLVIIGYDS